MKTRILHLVKYRKVSTHTEKTLRDLDNGSSTVMFTVQKFNEISIYYES